MENQTLRVRLVGLQRVPARHYASQLERSLVSAAEATTDDGIDASKILPPPAQYIPVYEDLQGYRYVESPRQDDPSPATAESAVGWKTLVQGTRSSKVSPEELFARAGDFAKRSNAALDALRPPARPRLVRIERSFFGKDGVNPAPEHFIKIDPEVAAPQKQATGGMPSAESILVQRGKDIEPPAGDAAGAGCPKFDEWAVGRSDPRRSSYFEFVAEQAERCRRTENSAQHAAVGADVLGSMSSILAEKARGLGADGAITRAMRAAFKKLI